MYLPEKDDHGVDGSIKSLGRGINQVDFQLKSTRRYEIRNEMIYYDLRVEDYNRLILSDDLPRVLILYLMPDDETEWLVHSSKELCLRYCAYWVSLMGMPHSINTSTERVAIPTANMLDPAGLQNMFDSTRGLN